METEEKSPVQYHFIVFAEVTEDGIEWSIDYQSSILDDGSVYDPNRGWNDGWRHLDDNDPADVDSDNRAAADLQRRLNANIVG